MKLIKTLFYGMLSIHFTGMADYVEPTEYAWPSEYYITDEYNQLIFVLPIALPIINAAFILVFIIIQKIIKKKLALKVSKIENIANDSTSDNKFLQKYGKVLLRSFSTVIIIILFLLIIVTVSLFQTVPYVLYARGDKPCHFSYYHEWKKLHNGFYQCTQCRLKKIKHDRSYDQPRREQPRREPMFHRHDHRDDRRDAY